MQRVKLVNRVKSTIAGCMAACLSFFAAHAQGSNTGALPYKSDSIEFVGKQTGLRYGATITMPVGGGRHTAAIIVSGTGAQDRDGTMAGHKLFADIADYLTRRGIVVLRVDDRGVGRSTGDYSKATTADFAADVLEAFNYVQQRNEVDKKRVGLIGHSEGGATISIAASQQSRVAFLVSLAGLCQDGYSSLILQNRSLVAAAPINDADKQRYNTINERMFKTARQYADSANMDQKLNECYAEWKKQDDEYVKAQNIQYDHFRFPIYSYVNQATGAWYRYFIKYNPAVTLANVRIPILALNGNKDLMVNSEVNLDNWKKLPDQGHNKDVTTITLPGLNHLFLPCITCTPQEYSTIKNSFSPDALKIIGDWIAQRFPKAKG